MLRLITLSQVLSGMLLLGASLVPIHAIISSLNSQYLRRSWVALGASVILLMAGYAVFGWLHLFDQIDWVDVVAALIMLLVSGFVMSVSLLSRLTAKNLLRLADLEREVLLDPLTGLFNRRYLKTRLDEEISRAERHELALSVLMIDIDHFKGINDTFGHLVGDNVIRQVARVVSEASRPSDTAIRYGGEEMLVVASQTDLRTALAFAERLRAVIADQAIKISAGKTTRVTASFGVSSFEAGDTCATLVERADRAVYAAKRTGRNRVCAPDLATAHDARL